MKALCERNGQSGGETWRGVSPVAGLLGQAAQPVLAPDAAARRGVRVKRGPLLRRPLSAYPIHYLIATGRK